MNELIDIHTHKPAKAGSMGVHIMNLYEHFEQAEDGRLCSMGLHPWYITSPVRQMEALKKHCMLPNVAAIGECGLDRLCDTDWDVQLSALRWQVKLANEIGKPIIIHCVRAFDELLNTLKEEQPLVPVIIHGFNKKWQVAEQLRNRGYYLSFGASIMGEVAPAVVALQRVHGDQFFLETDDSGTDIKDIYERAAQVRETTMEAIILQLQQNFKTVFNR